MNVLRQSNQRYLDMIGKNIPDPNKNHRFITYLLISDIDGGKIIFNELTRSFIWISYEQFNNIFNEEVQNQDYIDFLWKNFFIVNEDFDEQKCQQKLKDTIRPNPDDENFYLKSGNIREYTIFTTMACNARCFYCYEKGRPQVPMKAETARKVANYIVRTAKKTGERISLRWFGGEPLVNENVIDIICKAVQDAGFNYTSTFTTNGFLLKEEKIKKYKELWHFESCQITLDGTEEIYNKAKNYKNVKGKNPYQIVMDNIKLLLENDIHISIRMNMDQYNADNIKELIKELHEKFGNNYPLDPYCYPIFEDDDNPRTDEEKQIIYKKLKEIEDVLNQYGYYNKPDRGPYIAAIHCMIDNGQSVVIGTQGDIGLCEHYSEDHFWGHVDKPEMKDTKIIKAFQDYMPDLDMCKNCPILPSCIRPNLCHDLRSCDKYKKDWHIREAMQSIKLMYFRDIKNLNNQNNYQNNCNNNCNNNCDNNCNNQNNIEQIEELSFWKKLKIKFGLK